MVRHVFCLLSNLLGIFPITYCLVNKAFGLALVLFLAYSLSAVYHIDEKNDFALFADVLGCSLLFATAVVLLKRTEKEKIFSVANVFTVLYFSAAMYCYLSAGDCEDDEYNEIHAAWHVLATYAASIFLYTYFEDKNKSRFLLKSLGARRKKIVDGELSLQKDARDAIKHSTDARSVAVGSASSRLAAKVNNLPVQNGNALSQSLTCRRIEERPCRKPGLQSGNPFSCSDFKIHGIFDRRKQIVRVADIRPLESMQLVQVTQ
jgi:hypothetical protein